MFAGCNADGGTSTMFVQKAEAETNISFTNQVTESVTFNITTYEYLYNGGGVAAGDVNNDGLTDIYFTGNMVPNALYLNKGNLRFENVTQPSGVSGRNQWKTGTSMVDINADGWLDIYVCYSGPGTDAERSNQLFINKGLKNGVPVFEEQAKAYGLDAPGTFTTQCAFFDMDRDGDLDAFMVNHADMFYNVFYNTTQLRKQRHPQFGNRLYRNDDGHFTEVSDAAGISGSGINFGLGVAIDDVNGDNWPDIYVTNDYNEQDFLYLNQRDGTFSEVLQQAMGHISQFSMGADMSDLNNDGLNDIITLDMLPQDNFRQKLLKGPEGYDYYQLMVDSGYHHQNMRNMLQLNMGIAPDGLPRFSEIGQWAGMSQTDWSWSPLVADFDNDGHKDLYVTNGYLRDFTNMDFLKYSFAEAQSAAQAKGDTLFAWQVIKDLQGTKINNYLFRNNGRLQFENVAPEWGLGIPSVSTGGAYADLDNDGDLDLVINNTNQAAMVFENKLTDVMPQQHYLQVKLQDSSRNKHAIGACIRLYTPGGMQQQTLFPSRGFQSSSQPIFHFGLGSQNKIDSAEICWPNGVRKTYTGWQLDTMLVIALNQNEGRLTMPGSTAPPVFEQVVNNGGFRYLHQSDGFVDFKRLFTLPHQISRQGPFVAVADVNGDGREDVFIGGNDLKPGQLYLQHSDGQFSLSQHQPWLQGRVPDGGLCFVDADGDGDKDLYVARHGMQLNEGDGAYQHQLYSNDGKGQFKLATQALPDMRMSSTVVAAADYNKDGKMDLLVGGRSVPGRYPVVPTTYLLRNVSSGNTIRYEYASEQQSALLRQPGLVTAAVWTDVNRDDWPDLVLAGEYMPITLLLNQKGQLTDATVSAGFGESNGWWCSMAAADLDNDGDMDLITGNAGLNLPFRASVAAPVTLHYNDFDRNGIIDPVMTYFIDSKEVPALGLDDMAEQTPVLRKKFIRYEQYAKAGWNDLYDASQTKGAMKMQAFELQSCWWENKGNGTFAKHLLPAEAQFSTLQSVVVRDVDADGKKDLIAAGNFYDWRTQWGQVDACYGWVFHNKGHSFETWYPVRNGLWLEGNIRAMAAISTANGFVLCATRYGANAILRKWKGNP
jgi:hypothetical protein